MVAASVIVTVPSCSVSEPESSLKASTKSDAVPDNAPSESFSVILPDTASLIVFNCAVVGSSVIITCPVYVVIVSVNASVKSEAVPYNIAEVSLSVIVPDTASLISFNLATLTVPVIVTLPV